MLEKLMVEFTRSRPNRSSDDALVEGKNGAVIRKHLNYGHIASQHAEQIQTFLHGALQSLSELPSALRLCSGSAGPTGPAAPKLSQRRLCHALREASHPSGRVSLPQRGDALGVVGPDRLGTQRYCGRSSNVSGQKQPATAVQVGIAFPAEVGMLTPRGSMQHCDDFLGNLLLLQRHTGMRIGECVDLTRDCLFPLVQDHWATTYPSGN
jgi:hypothetical protein